MHLDSNRPGETGRRGIRHQRKKHDDSGPARRYARGGGDQGRRLQTWQAGRIRPETRQPVMEPNPPSRPNAHAIFIEALEKLLPEERSAFLDEACAGHRGPVREAVEALLREHQAKFPVSATLSGRAAEKATVKEGPGDTIGRYKLRRRKSGKAGAAWCSWRTSGNRCNGRSRSRSCGSAWTPRKWWRDSRPSGRRSR